MNRYRRSDEEGAAIIMVLLLGLIAVALVSAMMVFASTSTPLARNDQDWNGSLAAAESGIDDYLYRLSKDSSYWQKATDTNNQALGASAPGVSVPGGASEARFKYTVTPPTVTLNGTVKLRVEGTVRDNTRTLEATLRRDGFLDYLYFSKFETVDPLAYSTSSTARPTRDWAEDNCGDHYYYAVGNPGDPGYIAPRDTTGDNSSSSTSTWVCSEIRWVTGDTLDGPLHTNDALRVDGDPIFKGKVTTSWAKALTTSSPRRWIQHDSTASNPQFQDAANQAPSGLEKNNPIIATRLDPPADNSELLTDALAEGCVYDGPTFIRLKSTSTGKATWDVVSPGTTFSAACGGGSTSAQTDIVGPTNFNGVIYIRNKTGTCTYATHPNASYKYPQGLPVPVIEPSATSGSLTTAQRRDITTYDCLAGDGFVQGTLNGQLTIGAQNNIVITNHVKYADTTSASDDILGLITNNFIELIHPVRSSGGTSPTYTNITGFWDATMYPSPSSERDPMIMAAMLSVKHSFRVQNHDKGARPGSTANLLKVRGAIAQIYRGPVGTSGGSGSGTGFLKDYKYDSRLKLLSPPHFLDPVQSAWKVKAWAEVKTD